MCDPFKTRPAAALSTPTWGQMIRDGTVYLTDLPLLSLVPDVALLFTVFAFNLVGDGLRDVLDPRSK